MLKNILFGGTGCATKVGDAALFILRVFAGLAFAIAHGLPKIQDSAGAISSARGLNFPMPEVFGWAAILSESLGGILLALGLLTRPAAFFLACTMVVAAFMIHGEHPFQKQELAFIYLTVMVLFMAIGGGRFSVDALIRGGGSSSRG
jgi:putative oxidoreductase